jgi:hypothetical protein
MSALLVLGIFGGGFALLIGARAVRTTLVLRRLRGSDERREHDMERVASYLSLAPAGAALIPERAWNDLDMDEVFQRLDRTTSWPGQHQFYLRLRREDHSFQTLRRFELGVDRSRAVCRHGSAFATPCVRWTNDERRHCRRCSTGRCHRSRRTRGGSHC